MGIIKNLKGQKFGKLTVLEDSGIRKNRQVVWHCLCDCGKETDVVGQALRTGHTTSCGCKIYESRQIEDLSGKKFGKLTVIEEQGRDARRNVLWLCKCDCGNFRVVTGSQLRKNIIKECRECATFSKTHIDYTTTSWYKNTVNKKFGLLTAIRPTEKRDNAGRVMWLCQCDCGNTVLVNTLSLKSGNTSSCGCLNHTSVGEAIITKILEDNNISFIRQKSFDDCLSPKKSKLKFDFYLVDKNIIIEYDGIQHFQPIDFFGGEEGFQYLQQCDNIKNTYCNKNNIILKRIPYTELENLNLDLLLGDKYDII